MNNEEKEKYLLNILIIKMLQLIAEDDIKIDINDLTNFVNKYEFKQIYFGKRELIKFVRTKKTSEIVDFVWTEAIINPKIEND
ncbi:MAG: hypothetical protein GQ557_00270 [Mycoplasmataceae bacterium]|nr:hypothetical protein [Mycoplasmataceae bacterium]